jgi:predicted  nucleic acid-binding Zn-ribbon protein
LKSKSSKTIEDLEKKLTNITDKCQDMQKLYEQKLADQQTIYHGNIKQCGNDYEKKIQSLKHEIKELNQKIHFINEEKQQIKIDYENKVIFKFIFH